MTALIIDTDIGTDIDDHIAVHYAIAAGMDLKLITTVHGDTKVRAEIANYLVDALNYPVPVIPGEEKPIKQTHMYWTGLEEKMPRKPLPEKKDEEKEKGKEKGKEEEKEETSIMKQSAADAIYETVMKHKGDINIASIAPTTNIARAFEKYPDLPQHINTIYMMGNAIIRPDEYFINYRAHNFKVDPEAVDIVMAADVKKVIVTTEVCKKNAFTVPELCELAESPPWDTLNSHALAWLNLIKCDHAFLYDPLVVAHHSNPAVTTKKSYGMVAVVEDVAPGFKERIFKALKNYVIPK